MSSEIELKACPFCGQSDMLTIDFIAGDDWCVECERCHVMQHAVWPNKYSATMKWNTRANADQKATRQVRLEDIDAIGTAIDQLKEYAQTSNDMQYGSLSASLVEDICNVCLLALNRMDSKHDHLNALMAAPPHDRSRDADGNPRVLWISKEAIALTLEDCKEGEGVMYVLPEAPTVDAGVERLKKQIEYSSYLQQIIEALCHGHSIPEPKTTARYHYDMAVAARAHLESVRGKG